MTEQFVNFNNNLDVVRLFNSFGWVAAEKPLLTLILDLLIGGAVGLVVLLTRDSVRP